jgi:hypothetical protein
MKRYLLATVLAILPLLTGGPSHAETPVLEVQFQNPSEMFVGTWHSGNFAYTFSDDGTYVYVGAMGGPQMQSQISEEGYYMVSGDALIIQRQRGLVATSMNYRRDLEPETTTFGWSMGNTQIGLGLKLIYPDGRSQIFYKQ